jgi:malate dehydrogenase (oxaloacetate-decarboxylating)(NADP+)
MHIVNTKRGVFFLADTMINHDMDEEALFDVTRLARYAVEYFNRKPVMAMISSSNFGSNSDSKATIAHKVVERMQKKFPELPIDGEMQINYALNAELRDSTYPFTRLNGKEVNTLIFPSVTAANTAFRLILEMGVGEAIGPIQIGLNKPVHLIDVDSPVRDIVNLATIAVLDATVLEKIKSQK